MDINLCYVDGISRIDTPYFTSGSEQTSFFASKIVGTVTTTFYPPHYRNKIRFSTEDLNISDHVNYLYFTYKNKNFYYFVDAIEYVSEDIIEIDISMDYIQTYFFDIRVKNGIIERKHINRFISNNVINRSYIRENVSNGDFINRAKVYTQEYPKWVVLKVTELEYATNRKVISYIDTGKGVVPSPFYYITFPLDYNSVGELISYDYTNSAVIWDRTTSIVLLNRVIERLSPYISDAYVVPFCIFNPSRNYISNNKLYFDAESLMYCRKESGDVDDYHFVIGTNVPPTGTNVAVPIPVFIKKYDLQTSDFAYSTIPSNGVYSFLAMNQFQLDFSKNVLLSTPFSPLYIPQLIDDNYIRVEYGNSSYSTSYPLFKVNEIGYKIIGISRFDVSSGITMFGIIQENSFPSYVSDYYDTFVLDTNVPIYDVVVSSEQQYIANNHNRWAVAGLKIGSNILSRFVGAARYGLEDAYINSDINSLVSNKRNYDARYTRQEAPLKKGAARELNSLIRSGQMNTLGGANQALGIAMDLAEPIISQGLADNNSMYVPDKPQQVASVIPKLISDAINPWYRYIYVNDLSQVANYYHLNGFKVDEYVVNKDNIFAYVQNRVYFNIIKLRSANIHLANVIEDDDTISHITNRFERGVRLWNAVPAAYHDTFSLENSPASKSFNLSHLGSLVGVTVEGLYVNATLRSFTPQGEVIITFDNYRSGSASVIIHSIYSNSSLDIGNFVYDNVEKIYFN